MTREASAIASAWRLFRPGTPPVGFTLREDRPDEWVRLYTLPDGKRVPSSDMERRTVLQRWNEVASLVFEVPGAVGVLVFDSELPPAMERMGMDRLSSCPDEWLRRLDAFLDMSAMGIWVGALRWTAGCLDALVLTAVTDGVGPVTVCSLETADALCPYDGGIDTFLRKPLRSKVATTFHEWVA